ncbi:hypothetical protein GCM10009122_59640 [Fulvivirga kasyanovii]|uniref:Helix-turn-helix domain-containing protein n=1 Tax=Fulvivirga kasyanovii TaxID=396812 RepID=A0ABW9RKR4_9BACT|nr:helix-turn-helix domain-containing protein [Fulvivirga kasyanovii]MTI24683.1 helix-turn-helix domain-containing protein [Fulvivirga kasyanovii]
MMKQPELGKKISELRKLKGWTQEELVEKCNISVHTIQRIETGEVTPRSYTIKTILSALDSDFDKVVNKSKNSEYEAGWIEKLASLGIEGSKASDFVITQLNVAWIAGIIYLILSFIEGSAEVMRFMGGDEQINLLGYTALKIAVLATFILFQRGFIAIGNLFDNYVLRVVSLILIGANLLIISYDIISVFFPSVEREMILIGGSILLGAAGVMFGVALQRLEKSLGNVAKYAAIFEIIAGCLFITVIFALPGDVIHIVAELLGIAIIFKVIEIIKSGKQELA